MDNIDTHHHHPENSDEYSGLTVNSGVPEPPKVNPYLKPRKRPLVFSLPPHASSAPANPAFRKSCPAFRIFNRCD